MIGVAVLGSTGSIGRQTLEVIAALPDRFAVRGLAAGHGDPSLLEQLHRWPDVAWWCPDTDARRHAPERWTDGGLSALATRPDVELVVVATTGMAALPAVLDALGSGRRVALANKETLVTGGHLVTRALDGLGAARLDWLRPIDSEHSAIWQCLAGERLDSVRRLVLTASGGPFRGRDAASLASVTPEDALAHPTWRMGPKITVDSATLVNKAFEVIEAKWLYQLPYPKIDAVIHPQSVVHSLVEFADGSYKAQMGMPDMRLPIQYALTYPDRMPSPAAAASPPEWGSLEFTALTAGAYPAYDVVRQAAEAGGNRGTILNAADEVAVEAFLAGRIPLPRIGEVIAESVDRWGVPEEPSLEGIVALDGEVRAALRTELALRGDA